MTNNAHIQVINYKDVRGNQLKYLQIQVGEKNHLINIGNKTYDAVNNLLNEGQEKEPTPRKEVKK